MAISSVGSSTSADALSVGAKAQPDRPKLPDRAKNEEQAFQGGQGATLAPSKQVEAPKPVVNAQGQTTGRIINTRA